MARNHLARPVLVCSKIVPASKECCLRQATHSWTILVFSAYASPWPHTAHRNPPGQRALNRYSRHCSSVPNRARNDGMSSGRSSGSIVISPSIADGRHHSRSMLQINLIRTVPDRQLAIKRTVQQVQKGCPITNLLWIYPTLPTPYPLRGHVRHIHRRLVMVTNGLSHKR